MKKEILAMLLAGGQGSRLGVLTSEIAKPAVLYGGKYRIIDFSLSNCINSGIDTVGVLTQYRPLKLNAHIGIGKPWDMDRMHGGVTILPPYTKEETGEWYKGTANAVYQNIHYIDNIDPRYVIILSGDHIYKMNYSKMLDFHKKKNAEATISVIDVPLHEASRYGIMSTDENSRITEFEEKPANPKSTLASMGVYIFNWQILKEFLIYDSQREDSEYDFGKNVIPAMLAAGVRMFAYRFDGYWRDVGTIHAYWESNMDLIKRVPEFNLYDPEWKIYTANPAMPPHYISPTGSVKTSIIGEGCKIYGKVRNSVIFPGVFVSENAEIEDSIVMSNSFIGKGTIIKKSVIGEHVKIGENVKMGFGPDIPNEFKPQLYNSGITVAGEYTEIPDGVEIGVNVMIDRCATAEDFYGKKIESGKSVFKGGVPNG